MKSQRRPFRGRRTRAVALLAAALAVLAAPPAPAEVPLLITPTRLVLGSDASAGQVNVVNRGDEAATVRVQVVNRHMTEDGRLVVADEPRAGERFADELLQFAPRRFRLPPGGGQTVRILARRPAGLERGEYRSHLAFRVEPPTRTLGQDGDDDSRAGDVNIRLVPVYGVSIPVIVRQGDPVAQASISDIEVHDGTRTRGGPAVSFRLHRQGGASVYGDVRVTHLPAGGGAREVARIRGVAVYPPLSSRRVSLPLQSADARALDGGRLRVEYVDHDDADRVLVSRVTAMQ